MLISEVWQGLKNNLLSALSCREGKSTSLFWTGGQCTDYEQIATSHVFMTAVASPGRTYVYIQVCVAHNHWAHTKRILEIYPDRWAFWKATLLVRVREKECELKVMNSRLMECRQGKYIASALGMEQTQADVQAGAQLARRGTMVGRTYGGKENDSMVCPWRFTAALSSTAKCSQLLEDSDYYFYRALIRLHLYLVRGSPMIKEMSMLEHIQSRTTKHSLGMGISDVRG